MKYRILNILVTAFIILNMVNFQLIHAQDEEACFELVEEYLLAYLDFADLGELFDYLDSLEEDTIDELLEESGGFELLDACENGELDDFEPANNVDNDDFSDDNLNIPEFTGTLEIQANPNADHPVFGVFGKYVNVFGVSVYATSDVPDAKILHAANVMAQYLDNDMDGAPDNPLIVAEMAQQNASLIMFNSEESSAEEQFLDNLDETYFTSTQPLYGFETHPEGSQGEAFDATLEEVLHLITHVGYASAYPEIFGEEAGSEVADAMNIARGGYFENIPTQYPAEAWYTYDDSTCDYGCQVTEYTYWALTTLLGAQDYPGRAGMISQEWQLTTAETLEIGDPAIYAILTNSEYHLPIVLPDGQYLAINDE